MPEALEDVRRRRRRRRATDHDEDAARRLDSEDQTEAERVADHLASAGRSLAEVRQMLDALSEAQRTAVVARLGQLHGNAFVVHLLQRPNVEGWLALHIVLQANAPTPELQMVLTQLRGKGVRFTAEALRVLLGLLRDSGQAQRMIAANGQYQQSLPQGKTYQLLRVRFDGADGLVPEISGHRLLVSIRFMRADAEGRLRPANGDVTFELTLCA